MVIAPWIIYAILAITVATAVYSYYNMRKMQRKNSAEPSQMDGSLADEGVSFSSVFGSPHIHGNITWIGNQDTQAIKSKGGKK